MANAFSDLNRPPLRQRDLERALLRDTGTWTSLRVVPSTGSTNADLAQAVRAGAPSGAVLLAEEQHAGRGRLDRTWSAPARSGLTFSVLLRPGPVPAAAWGWFSLLAGVAAVQATVEVTELEARLKWPNDVLVGERKLAGILAERVEDAVVLGIGLNVSLRPDELPVATSTSLLVAGSEVLDRAPVLLAVLRGIAQWYDALGASGWDPVAAGLRDAYRDLCATIGRAVQVELPGGGSLTGTATDVDAAGRLVVATAAGDRVVAAGDVVHVR